MAQPINVPYSQAPGPQFPIGAISELVSRSMQSPTGYQAASAQINQGVGGGLNALANYQATRQAKTLEALKLISDAYGNLGFGAPGMIQQMTPMIKEATGVDPSKLGYGSSEHIKNSLALGHPNFFPGSGTPPPMDAGQSGASATSNPPSFTPSSIPYGGGFTPNTPQVPNMTPSDISNLPYMGKMGQTMLGSLQKVGDITKQPLEVQKLQQDIAQGSNQKSQILRKEYTEISKDYRDVSDSYQRVMASANNPSAAGDLALIFNYMKMLDPRSTIRESEFAAAASAGSYGDRVKAAVNQVRNGQRLSDEMRADFVDRAGQLLGAQKRSYTQSQNQYTRLAKSQGVDPKDVVIEFTPEPAAPSQPGEMIRVRNKLTGKTGTIPKGNFNAEKYDRL